MTTVSNHHCLIIGGGIAGLMAATVLQNGGMRVTVVDKGRGIGGRLATRRINSAQYDEGIFDYGAQYFTARDPRFLNLVNLWQDAGVVREWSKGFHTLEGILKTDGEARFVGTSGMRGITKYLTKNLTAHAQTRITALTYRKNQWFAETESGNEFSADSVILTPPLPQTLQLLEVSGIPLADAQATSLKQIDYHTCIAMLALLKAPSAIPEPGGIWGDGLPIQWIADNQKKGISPQPAVTIHASPGFSSANWDTEKGIIAEQLLSAAERWFSRESLADYQIHKWRYSLSTVSPGMPYAQLDTPAPLLLTGDGFSKGRVEGAALAGLATADQLLNILN